MDTYMKGLAIIESDILDKVISEMNNYKYTEITDEDIKEALRKESLNVKDFQALLSPKAINYLEEMAIKAKKMKE